MEDGGARVAQRVVGTLLVRVRVRARVRVRVRLRVRLRVRCSSARGRHAPG